MHQLRGREGSRVREVYRRESKKWNVEWNGREYDPGDLGASDAVNQALSAGHACLYGLAHAVIAALGCSPALGFVHVGHERSFVYDIADLYKVDITIRHMVWSARGEQGMNFRVHNTSWQPIDCDGITLMMRPLPNSRSTEGAPVLKPGFSKASKARMIGRHRSRQQDDEHAETSERPADEPCYVVVDVETTGMRSDVDKILEIGALKVRGGIPTDEFCSLIRCDGAVPKEITKLTGISDELIASDGRDLDEVMRELSAFIGTERIVCHNARFDIGFLQAAAKRCGQSFMHGNKCEDTLALARRKIKGIRGFKLTDIAEHLSLDTTGAHRAMKDCYLTHWIYEKLNEKLNEKHGP